jgi:U32 family peptidase
MAKKVRLELLAPAGNMDKLKTAFLYGADAVYLGVPDFSLRVRINDFDIKGIAQAVEYAHSLGKKVYITVNIFAHNRHLPAFISYLKKLKRISPDALIVSDPGILRLIKKYWSKAELHLSTQANCTNLEAARFWKEQGIKRIILGREVSLSEIKKISRALPEMELEYFVHGAMCMAYSGRCFLSKLFVSRSANLGDCIQPCRWQYNIDRYFIKAEGHDEELELVEEKHGTYLLNSYDLCLLKELPLLVSAGISSFKIEGRAKSVYYQAVVCASYRRGLDLVSSSKKDRKFVNVFNYLYKELETKLVHRGYTTGFLLGEKAGQNIKDARHRSAWEFCGQVLAKKKEKGQNNSKDNLIFFKVHNTIKVGDQIEIILPGYKVIKIKVKELFSSDGMKTISEAHGGGGGAKVFMSLPKKTLSVPELSVIRRKINNKNI